MRVQIELQRFLVYLSTTLGAHNLLAWPDTELHTHTDRETSQNPYCHSTAPAGNTKATSSHCVRPSPFIPFHTGCSTTKAEKLRSCVDDRATNLFGGTHYISSLYSSAAERVKRRVFVKKSAPTMPCYYLWNNSYIPYGTDVPIKQLFGFVS